MIGAVLAGLVIQASNPVPSECVYHAVAAERRMAIGQMILARKSQEVAAATLPATDVCAKRYRWASDQAIGANGYATMRMAAESIAYELGHNGWADHGLAAVNTLTGEQRVALAGTATDKDGAIFRAVMAHMEGAGAGVAGVLLRTEDPEKLRRFVLMVKFLALARMQQDRVTQP